MYPFARAGARLLLPAVQLATFSAPIGFAGENSAPQRIVSTDGITTEMLFALGAGDRVIARDEGSTFPEAAQALPLVGAGHQLNAEAVVAMNPDLVVGRDRAMNKGAFTQLEKAGLTILRLKEEAASATFAENVTTLAKLLGVEAAGAALIARVEGELGAAQARLDAMEDRVAPKVLGVYMRPGAMLMLGEESQMMTFAKMAGGKPALAGMRGFKPINAEAVAGAQPEILLCYSEGLETVGGVEGLLALPGMADTPAGKHKRIVAVESLRMGGFGPRAGETVLALIQAFYETDGPYLPGEGK